MNKLTAEKCREQFEAHIRNLDGDYNLIRVGEVYIDVETQIEWRTWQAAWNKALEIAPPILDQQERGDWIEWGGGDCPLKPGDICDIKCRDGEFFRRLEDYQTDWKHDGTPADIIAYRIIPEQIIEEDGSTK